MFNQQEVLSIRHGKPGTILLSGAITGIILYMVPVVILLLVTTVKASRIRLLSDYLSDGWPYALLTIALSMLLSYINRVNLIRGRCRTTTLSAPGVSLTTEVLVGNEIIPIAVITPIVIAFVSPNAAKVLAMAAGTLFLSGLLLYALWAWPHGRFVVRFAAVSREVLLKMCLDETLKSNDWLSQCRIESSVIDGNSARLTGFVSRHEQIHEARLAALKVRGIEAVDVSALRIGRPPEHSSSREAYAPSATINRRG